MKTHLTTIPFSGFYNSSHDAIIEDALEQYFSDENGESDNYHDFKNYKTVMKEYSEVYLDAFNDNFNDETGLDIKFEFDDLQSPREYNFTTDIIFATLNENDLTKLYSFVSDKYLQEAINNNFTPHSGFIPFYKNDLGTWKNKPVSEFDHNEIGTLIEAAMLQVDLTIDEYSLMEHAICNGVISNIVEAGL